MQSPHPILPLSMVTFKNIVSIKPLDSHWASLLWYLNVSGMLYFIPEVSSQPSPWFTATIIHSVPHQICWRLSTYNATGLGIHSCVTWRTSQFYCLLHHWKELVQTMFIAYPMAIARSLLFCWYAFLTHRTNGKYSNKEKWMLGKTAFHIYRWMWLCLIWCLEPLQLSWDNEGRYCPQTEDAKGKNGKVPNSIIALGCWTKPESIAFELLMRNNK